VSPTPDVKSSKFFELEHYDNAKEAGYELLPFRFIRLDSSRYVLTNEVGEILVVPNEVLPKIVYKQVERSTDIYNDLKSKHMIIDADSKVALDLLALKYRTKANNLANFTALHLFVVTLRCDHTCPYCQVSRQTEDKEAFDMSQETAAKSLDFTFKSPSPSIKIEFQGGEPLLNFDLIRWIVLEAEKRNVVAKKNLAFVIATNLALLTEEILQFCLEHDIHLSTSLDGPEDLHLSNRPRPGKDSHPKVIAGIYKAREVLGPDRVSALMTTTKSSLGRCKEIVDEYLKHDFDSIFLRPLSPYGFAVKTKWYESYDISEWLDFYFEGLKYIIEINKSGKFFVEQYAAIILGKMFSPSGTLYVDLQSPAGTGISAVLFNYNSKVYSSDEARMLAEMNDETFCIGNVLNKTYEEMMLSDSLLQPLELSITESSPSCHDCGFQPFCGSDPSYHYATQKDVVGHKALSGFCKKNMAIMRKLVTLMEDDAEARKILLSWVR